MKQINTLVAPEIGTPATYYIGSDSYPAVVTAVSPSGKTIWIRLVSSLMVEHRPIGTGHDAVETILDFEEVESAIEQGKNGATKFMLRTENSKIRNGRESEEHGLPVGTPVLRQRWSAGKGRAGNVSFGRAVSKRDPHL